MKYDREYGLAKVAEVLFDYREDSKSKGVSPKKKKNLGLAKIEREGILLGKGTASRDAMNARRATTKESLAAKELAANHKAYGVKGIRSVANKMFGSLGKAIL